MKIILMVIAFLFVCHCTRGQTTGQLENDLKSAANTDQGKVWTFAFSNDGYPANYLNTNGKLVGQSVDIVKEVCKLAGKQCKLVTVERKDCWNDKPTPGYSTDQGRYDVCANLVKSPYREIGYLFGERSIYNIPHPVLIVSPNSTIITEELKKCNDYKLAYARLTAASRDCLTDGGFYVRKKYAIPVVARTTISEAMDTIVKKVIQGKSDLGLVLPRFVQFPQQVKYLDEVPCSRVLMGLNMMTHRNNTAFMSWWNPALQELICSNQKQYDNFCSRETNKYGVDAMCSKPGEETDCSEYGLPFSNKATSRPEPASSC